MSPALLADVREPILRVARSHGASKVRVFGSLARGEGRPSSDLDLLVSLEAGRALIDLVAMKQEIEDLLDRPVDVVTDRGLSPYLKDRILAEAVDL